MNTINNNMVAARIITIPISIVSRSSNDTTKHASAHVRIPSPEDSLPEDLVVAGEEGILSRRTTRKL